MSRLLGCRGSDLPVVEASHVKPVSPSALGYSEYATECDNESDVRPAQDVEVDRLYWRDLGKGNAMNDIPLPKMGRSAEGDILSKKSFSVMVARSTSPATISRQWTLIVSLLEPRRQHSIALFSCLLRTRTCPYDLL